jgi:outer membrane protein assembly factor BamB
MRPWILATISGLAAMGAPVQTRALGDGNWPEWRGPRGQGVGAGTGYVFEWSPTSNVAWKTPIPGRGHSSPVVWEDKIFLTTAVEGDVVEGAVAVEHRLGGEIFVHPESLGADRKHTMKVVCVARSDGKILWEKSVYEGTVFDGRHRRGSFASPTSATDGERVISYFGAEGVYCHDLEGREVWRANVGKIATLGMGTASSPVLSGELVILLCDQDEGADSFIAGLDKRTGKEAWRTRREIQVSWTTPVLSREAGRTEILACGTEWILAYDPNSGKELWRSKGLESNAIHTPLLGDGFAIFSAGYPAKRVLALRTAADTEPSSDREIWRYERGTAYVASPILYEARVYLLSDRGVVSCLDAKSGKVWYDNGRVPSPASFYASPVAADGKLLLASEQGDVFVLDAGETCTFRGKNSIGEPIYASPAPSRGEIFLRGENHLWCIRAPEPKSS